MSVHAALAAWTEADLDAVGRVREVVRAPARVLSTDGGRVDPTSPDVVQLAADLVATMRVSPGLRRPRRAAGGGGRQGLLRRRVRAPQDP